MMIRGFVRTVKTGAPVPDGTEVAIRRHVDNSLIGTVPTVGGMYEYFTDGSPGPYYVQVSIGEEVHISSSKVVGMSGPLDVGGLPLYFRLWGDGYISGILQESSVFSSGAGMAVTVRPGVHLIRGVLYDQAGNVDLPVDAPSTQPRIDTVVIETMVPGSGPDVEGRTRLVVKKGTPAATPSAPSLTQTTTIWEHPLADVRVDPAVSAIASNKITDRRIPANVKITNGYISTAMLGDGIVTTSKIAPQAVTGDNIAPNTIGWQHIGENAVGASELADNSVDTGSLIAGSVTASKIADGAVTTQKLDTGAVTNSTIGPAAVSGSKINTAAVDTVHLANNAVNGDRIAPRSVRTGHLENLAVTGAKMADGTIVESKLHQDVRDKLNAHGYNHATDAPTGVISVTSTSWNALKSQSLSLPAGRWALFLQMEGQAGSLSDGAHSAMQVRFTGTAAGGLVASHAIQNVESDRVVMGNFSFNRFNVVTLSASTTITLLGEYRKASGANGKMSGVVNLYAIKVG